MVAPSELNLKVFLALPEYSPQNRWSKWRGFEIASKYARTWQQSWAPAASFALRVNDAKTKMKPDAMLEMFKIYFVVGGRDKNMSEITDI